MKKFLSFSAWILMLGLGLGGAPGCRRAPGAFPRDCTLQVNVGPNTAWGQGAQKFTDLVTQKTGGRIRLKPCFGSSLLKGAQLHAAQMVASGAIDAAFESTINTAPVVGEMNIFSLPFFVAGYAQLDRLEAGETGRLVFDAMRAKGLEPLAWGENGFRQLTNSRRPVQNPEDLRQLKIRVVGTAIFMDIFHALAADPVNMNWGDAVTALQQGTVDGQENPVAILLPLQVQQFQKYLTVWNYLADPLVIYWCKQDWDQFPPDIQQAIREAAVEAARYEKMLCRVGLDDGSALRILREEFQYAPPTASPLAELEQGGMIIHRLSSDEYENFRQQTDAVRREWAAKLGDGLYQAALRDLGP